MWTDQHRTRHETRLKDVVMQAGLDEVARFLERADPATRPNAKSARAVMAAIAWHLRTGGGWRALPEGFLPWRTVYGWFRRWVDKGLFETLMRALARRQRRRCGRRATPTLRSSTRRASSASACEGRVAMTAQRKSWAVNVC
jgi:putative transposase